MRYIKKISGYKHKKLPGIVLNYDDAIGNVFIANRQAAKYVDENGEIRLVQVENINGNHDEDDSITFKNSEEYYKWLDYLTNSDDTYFRNGASLAMKIIAEILCYQ